MRINTISLYKIRNYDALKLELANNINVFEGNNGQGKTNILEAIYLAAIGKSFRTFNDAEIIKWQSETAAIDISFTRQEVNHLVGLRFIRNKPKEIYLNEYKIRPKDLVGNLAVVIFSPDDLDLIKGQAAIRRKFIDLEIAQTSSSYYKKLLEYNRVLAQRNRLLKEIKDKRLNKDILDGWNEQLASLASFIVNKRLEALKKINMLANLLNRKLTKGNENLQIEYIQAYSKNSLINDIKIYLKMIEENTKNDIFRGYTSIGPHRDDLVFLSNGINLRIFGSQGQQRTSVLALKLSELEYIKSEIGEYPVLLLDDIMSELDKNRREQLIAFIKDNIQTFITTTDAFYFENKTVKFYHVDNGKIGV